MTAKLYRCSTMWLKGPHPCWRVQRALDESGVEYEVVPGPLRRGKRDQMMELTGQRLYPAIQRADGTVVKRSSKELIEMIKAGEFS
jgi:Glutathione S-transferase, N-terminal domain